MVSIHAAMLLLVPHKLYLVKLSLRGAIGTTHTQTINSPHVC